LTSLRQVLLEATKSHLAARSPRGKFYRYAREHGLGKRKSHDFSFEHAGIKYTAQAFETGIVYAPVGQWGQITHAEYEG
jgi:hypothetical protein